MIEFDPLRVQTRSFEVGEWRLAPGTGSVCTLPLLSTCILLYTIACGIHVLRLLLSGALSALLSLDMALGESVFYMAVALSSYFISTIL